MGCFVLPKDRYLIQSFFRADGSVVSDLPVDPVADKGNPRVHSRAITGVQDLHRPYHEAAALG